MLPTAAGCGALGDLIFAASRRALPAEATRAARRTLLNVSGTAIAASRHPVLEHLVTLSKEEGGEPVSIFAGRPERGDVYYSALVNGTAAQLFDFDDTQLSTVLHPGAGPFGAFVALGAAGFTPTCDPLTAYGLGVETSMRVARAISPWHYDAGWHITGTCGVLGASVTAALFLGADAGEISAAIGVAADGIIGHREAFGTGSKTLHGGKSASNGLLAAQLALRGIRGAASLDSPGGFFTAFSSGGRAAPAKVVEGFGDQWEICNNTFKPYACGIVIHPAIDAAIALRERVKLSDIVKLRIIANPLVSELTNIAQPEDELQAIFSVTHGIAAGLLYGSAGLFEYAPERVRSEEARAIRAVVEVVSDPNVAADAGTLEALLDDGSFVRESIDHARGSLARPLTDIELAAKVRALTEPVLPGRSDAIIETAEALERGGSLSAFLASIVPASFMHDG